MCNQLFAVTNITGDCTYILNSCRIVSHFLLPTMVSKMLDKHVLKVWLVTKVLFQKKFDSLTNINLCVL